MDAFLERLALVYGVLAVLVAVLPLPRARRLGSAGLALLALSAAADEVGGSSGGAPGSFTTINEILGLAGILLVVAALFAAVLRRLPGPAALAEVPPRLGHPGLDPLLLAGGLLAALAPDLVWMGLGLLLCLSAAIRGSVRARARLWLVPLLLGAGLLGIGLILVITIMGPLGPRLSALPAGPFSPPAERLLVLLLGGAILLLAGLPPLTWATWRLSLAPVGAIVLVRILAPGFPQGLAEWRSLAILLLTGMLSWAALTRRWAAVAVSGGLAALWSGDPGATGPGVVLVGSGWVADQWEVLRLGRGGSLPPRWGGVPMVVPAVAALPALVAVLRVEVVLTTSIAVVLAICLARDARQPVGP